MNQRQSGKVLVGCLALAMAIVLLHLTRTATDAGAQTRASVSANEPRLAALESGLGRMPLGTIVPWHATQAGAHTLARINAAGWVVCDGTDTSEVAGALIATTPDLTPGLFLRGTSGSSGPQEAPSDASHQHALDHDHPTVSGGGTTVFHHHGPSSDGVHEHTRLDMGDPADPPRYYGQLYGTQPPLNAGFAGDTSWAIDNIVCSAFPLQASSLGSLPLHTHSLNSASETHEHTIDLNSLSPLSGSTGSTTIPSNMTVYWIMRVK